MTYDQWKDPTDCSPDDNSDWLSLVDAFEDERRGYHDCVQCGDGKRECTCGLDAPVSRS